MIFIVASKSTMVHKMLDGTVLSIRVIYWRESDVYTTFM